jgi:hypothetical protein
VYLKAPGSGYGVALRASLRALVARRLNGKTAAIGAALSEQVGCAVAVKAATSLVTRRLTVHARIHGATAILRRAAEPDSGSSARA